MLGKSPVVPGFCVVTCWWRSVQAEDFTVIMKCVLGVNAFPTAFCLHSCPPPPHPLVTDLRFEANDCKISMQRYCIHHCQSCLHAAKTPSPHTPSPRLIASQTSFPCLAGHPQSPAKKQRSSPFPHSSALCERCSNGNGLMACIERWPVK